ncbi:hypothetical protein G6F55_014336 [Rhizopus delemar]|nr:hypothetical protein G6F55_014336 [Rhizopus delemar]
MARILRPGAGQPLPPAAAGTIDVKAGVRVFLRVGPGRHPPRATPPAHRLGGAARPDRAERRARAEFFQQRLSGPVQAPALDRACPGMGSPPRGGRPGLAPGLRQS